MPLKIEARDAAALPWSHSRIRRAGEIAKRKNGSIATHAHWASRMNQKSVLSGSPWQRVLKGSLSPCETRAGPLPVGQAVARAARVRAQSYRVTGRRRRTKVPGVEKAFRIASASAPVAGSAGSFGDRLRKSCASRLRAWSNWSATSRLPVNSRIRVTRFVRRGTRRPNVEGIDSAS